MMDSSGPALEESDYLTSRQRQVIILAATGLTNLEIAKRLHISLRSVERDLTAACELYSVPNRTTLVLEAYRTGVVKDEHLEFAPG